MAKLYKQVAELGDIVTGKTPPTANQELWDGNIPFITPTDIKGYDTFYQQDTERTISQLGANKQKKTLLPKNSICVTCIGSTIGKSCITKVPSITNQQINSIIPNSNNDYRYVHYLVRENLSYLQLIGGGSGSGTPIISKNKFTKFKFLVEDNFLIQQKIASILSTYDTLIENNTKRIRLLEQMAENLYKEWFVRFRFPGHENVEMENGLPKGWKNGTLGDVVEFQNGFAFKSETFCEEGKFSVVTIKNVKDNGFEGNNTDKIDEIPPRMPSYCKLQEGDILLSLTGNIGRVCRVQGDNYLLNQRVAKIKSKHPLYCYCLFKSEYIYASLNVISYGTAQLNLSPVKASKIKLALPENELLERFEMIVEPIFTDISSLNHQNSLLIRQRDLLLPRLMSGKQEVKP